MITVELASEWRSDPGILLGRVPADLEAVLRLGVSGCEHIRWQKMLLGRGGEVVLISSLMRGRKLRLVARLHRGESGSPIQLVEIFGKRARMMRLKGGTAILRKVEGGTTGTSTE